jgi:hypothetical protein
MKLDRLPNIHPGEILNLDFLELIRHYACRVTLEIAHNFGSISKRNTSYVKHKMKMQKSTIAFP